MADHGWLKASTPKPRPAPPPSLGQVSGPTGASKPLSASEASVHDARHVGCVDHVKVEGFRTKVCIGKGQDPEAVIAEARELAGDRTR
jgi:hypothetical protein